MRGSNSGVQAITSSVALVSKSSVSPADRNSSVPSISNRPASAPVSDRSLVPSASSVMTMSATLMRAVVSVSSPIVVVVLARATVGASFESVTLIDSTAVSLGAGAIVVSSIPTVTSSAALVSKSRLEPALR